MPDVGTRKTVLFVDGTEYTSEVSKVVIGITGTDSDFVSFADAANGNDKDYLLKMTLKQNTSTTSLWDIAWTQAGADLDVEVWFNGRPTDGTPTTAQPMFDGTVTVMEPDGDYLGGEANVSNVKKQKADLEWKFLAKPVRHTA